VGSERRQHISQLRAEIIISQAREQAGLRVATGEIGRDDQHALARAELPERRVETGAQVSDGESVGGRAAGVIQHGWRLQRFQKRCSRERQRVTDHPLAGARSHVRVSATVQF